MNKITKKEFEKLCWIRSYGTLEDFNNLLEGYCDITARPCRMFDYYDESGNYIGSSVDTDVKDLILSAGINIVDEDNDD